MQEKQASRIFLVAAIIIGIIATGMAFLYLSKTGSEDHSPKYKMLQARHDLQPAAALDPDKDFDEVEIPERFTSLRERAIDPNVRSSYKGQHVNHLVLAGSYVLKSDLFAIGGIKLAADKRAMAVSVRGTNGILPDLYVGDLVKLYITRLGARAPAATAPATTDPAGFDSAAAAAPVPVGEPTYDAYPILPASVRILSIGGNASRTRRPVTAIEQYDSLSQSNNLLSVTIEVTEDQARTVLTHIGSGQNQVPVVLILCPPPAQSAAKP